MLAYDMANDEAKMSVEQHSCTVAMQTACECICDLFGLHAVDDDLRGVLRLPRRLRRRRSDWLPHHVHVPFVDRALQVIVVEDRAYVVERTWIVADEREGATHGIR